MAFGKMLFTLRTGFGALPVKYAEVVLSDARGAVVFSDLITPDRGGLSKTAVIETPPKELSLTDDPATAPYSVFSAVIRAEGFYRMRITGIKGFEDITSLLSLPLTPLPAGAESPESEPEIALVLPEHVLFAGEEPPEKGTARDPSNGFSPAIQIQNGVYIPENITVHVGAPDKGSENITLPFTDYIKNVAASEIYPTWPEESARANILAQISIALNRVYTEWYRSRGYDFDITSSTAYDQAFTPGGNTYEETDAIVDSIFNNYLIRPGFVEPLYASFCDGRNTQCDGLSQWGTVELAEDGRNTEEILAFYYGDVDVTLTDDIRAIEGSYPGEPLKEGDEGENVRLMQLQLNRIAINYPKLPLNNNFGVYDEQLTRVVREFQELFQLPVTGIIDKATWYKISYLYVSVKSLAELTSEGQRPSYNTQTYPGSPLAPGSKGSEVQEIQFYLRRISRFNPLVRPVNIDGIFDADTQESVRSFQNAYRLEVTGVIDERTWNSIVRIYNGTLENIDEPVLENGISPYPGTDLTFGSRGDQVEYVQRLLQKIRISFPIIPELDADGFFGAITERAVNTFAALFAYPQDGRVNEPLWNEINRIYIAAELGCIFATTESEGSRPYPGEAVAEGSSPNDVNYVQERINIIYTALPYIGQAKVDGIFGERTQSSIGALQRVFGLTVTETVNETTWNLLNYISAAVQNGCLPKDIIVSPAFSSAGSGGKTDPGQGIKALMRRNGLNPGFGPVFGKKSRKELAFWQAAHGLEPTGKPDKETLKRLSEY